MNEPGHEEYAWVTAALAADDPGPMPSSVSDRILVAVGLHRLSSTTAPDPPLIPEVAVFPLAAASRGPFQPAAAAASAAVVDPPERARGAAVLAGGRRSGRAEAASDRRHFLLYRLLPVAASMVVIAAASGVVAAQLRGEDAVDEAGIAATNQDAVAEVGPRPNSLVATGTAYTSASLAEQASTLVSTVAAGGARNSLGSPEASSPAQGGVPEASSPAQGGSPDAAVAAPSAAALSAGAADPFANNPLGSAAAFQQCASTLGAPEGVLPTAVDLATFDGVEAAIVVLPNRAGDGFEVIVTDRFCNPDSERASTTFVGG